MNNQVYCAEGASAAVYRPHFTSEETNNVLHPDCVGKVFANKYKYDEEIRINKIISTVDPQNNFTLKMKDYFRIHKKDFKNKEEIEKSRFFKRYNHINHYYQIIYQDGGIDLIDYVKLSEDLIPFTKLLKMFLNIFEGVRTLQNNGYIHFDIKPDNIVYNKKEDKLYLIDFGLFDYINHFYDRHNTHKHSYTYAYYPMECKLAHLIYHYDLTKTPVDYLIMILYDETKENIKDIECDINNYLKMPLLKNMREFIYEEFGCDKINTTKADFLNKYSHKLDVYSLGVTLLLLYSEYKDRKLDITEGLFSENFLLDLIENMMNFNPIERYNIVDSIVHLKEIIKKCEDKNEQKKDKEVSVIQKYFTENFFKNLFT